ncbi:inactive tyrosine-protein kinase 7-like [Uloborus diversus]|uniref:inactive tyrosine-protein kinase 7-like n=1 Tax=Uloborus diversus TaxID=327109 RepID=UPI002409BFA4|nr:inactive tyrosine-protein kinase 7-like [Uloborus diversus]
MKTLCLIASFICIALNVIADQDTLFFNPQPEDITAVEGYNATLKCGASSKRNITFYWTLDGARLENDTRRHMVGSNLYISRVSPLYDIGEFKCVATNVTTGRSIISRGAQINILWITDAITVIPTESSLEPKVGDELILRCKSEGNPEPQVTWYHNGEKLFRGEKVSLKANQLHKMNLSLLDNGVYSCRIINDVGSVNSSENFALKLSDAESPQITLIPQSKVVKENNSALFDCVFENAASTDWYFESNEHQLSNDTRYVIYPNGTLKIVSMSSDLVGLYKCQGVSKKPDTIPHQKYVAELQIAYIDDFLNAFDPHLNADQSVVVTVHESYDVTCLKPKGLPRPKMWWEDPKGHVINDSGQIYVQDMRLIFSEVQETDAGEYTCVAENIAGEHRKSFNLFVSAAPVVLRDPIDITVNEGEIARFECSYSNTSSTSVVWLKDDMYIKETGNHIVFNKNDGTLIIRNVSPSDAGLYQCEIRSAEFPPVHSNPASLAVKEKLKFIPAPVSRKLELGSNAKIYCKAGGSTPPLVNWTRTDSPSPEWPPHIKDDNGTLHFNRVLSTDTGKYMCIARNSQGIINATIDLDVIVMPKFSVQPSDTIANEGEPVILHCLAEGDPLPVIQWDKNNELNGFNQARFKVLENGSLFASEVHADDEGKYGCTAGNSGGLRRHEVTLTVKSKESNTNRIGRGGFGNESENTMTKTVAITLGAAGVYIVLVVSLMMWCRYRRARRKALMLAQATADAENSEVIHDMELKDRTSQKTRCNEVITNDESVDSKNQILSKLHFPRENLSTVMLLGTFYTIFPFKSS